MDWVKFALPGILQLCSRLRIRHCYPGPGTCTWHRYGQKKKKKKKKKKKELLSLMLLSLISSVEGLNRTKSLTYSEWIFSSCLLQNGTLAFACFQTDMKHWLFWGIGPVAFRLKLIIGSSGSLAFGLRLSSTTSILVFLGYSPCRS